MMAGNQGKRGRVRCGRQTAGLVAAVVAATTALAAPPPVVVPWEAIPADERALTDDPLSPGAPAILLFRGLDTDDDKGQETHRFRLKVLNPEGKKYANVEIRYRKGSFEVRGLRARTVRPDGSEVEFRGQVFETVALKDRSGTVLAKTFTFPEADVGSILEYEYVLAWNKLWLYESQWWPERELSIRRARFSLRPQKASGWEKFAGQRQFHLRWFSSRLPPGKDVRRQADGTLLLELENVPAFVDEPFMPPESELRMRVEFRYSEETPETPAEFWRRQGKEWHEIVEKFIRQGKGLEGEVTRLLRADDPPEARLRKLYARAQQVRNLSYERQRTEKEWKRLKDNDHVADVLPHGYATRSEINRFFVALARLAGFEAGVVRLSERDVQFFNPGRTDARQLDAELAVVQLAGRDLFLDPGTPYCPFGLAAWEKTGVRGIRLEAEGGDFLTTPEPAGAQAVVERKAALRLAADGTLEGQGKMIFRGRMELALRLRQMEEDEAGVRKKLEEDIKGWLPAGAGVELLKAGPWENTEEPLAAEFTLKLPQFAVPAGRRLLLPVAVFQSYGAPLFEHAERQHPVYFRYPWHEIDEVSVELPPGYELEGLPAGQEAQTRYGRYELRLEKEGRTLRFGRRLLREGFSFPREEYPALREFYSKVHAGDTQQAVLEAAEGKPGE